MRQTQVPLFRVETDDTLIGHLPTITSFNDAFPRNENIYTIQKCVVLHMPDVSLSSKAPVHIAVRVCIEKSVHKKQQPYIIGFRFYEFGKCATLDIISCNAESHDAIVQTYREAYQWYSEHPQYIESGTLHDPKIPVMCCGGYMGTDAYNNIRIDSVSRRVPYNTMFFTAHASDIVGYCLSLCVPQTKDQKYSFADEQVYDVLHTLFSCMYTHAGAEDFYEHVLVSYEKKSSTEKKPIIHSQHATAFLFMKSDNRLLCEGGDMKKILQEEKSGGIGKMIFLNQIRYHILPH